MDQTKLKKANKSTDDQLVIKELINKVEQKYGKGALVRLSNDTIYNQNVISSGSIILDQALGIGGYPQGRIVEIYGPEATGKTTLGLHAIAMAQQKNLQAVFIDLEHAFNPDYAKRLGVNLSTLIIGQPDSGEEALDIVETLIKTQKVQLILVDSVAALVPQAELEGHISEVSVGGQARLMSKALRKLRSIVHENNCLLIFINQVRSKINISWGNPETTSGGRALKFYASMRLEVRVMEKLVQNHQIYGNRIKVKIVKNKLANPFKTATLELIYGKGIDRWTELIQLGVIYNIIEKAGIWYSYHGQRLGQGKTQTRNFLVEHASLAQEIEQAISEKLNGNNA